MDGPGSCLYYLGGKFAFKGVNLAVNNIIAVQKEQEQDGEFNKAIDEGIEEVFGSPSDSSLEDSAYAQAESDAGEADIEVEELDMP